MRVRAHIFVYGRVQGVFFRYETYRLARNLGVTGWVRNLPDGRVEAVFEGEKGKVDKLIEFCKRGPRGALVTKIELSWEKPKNEDGSFEIRYY